MSNLIPAFDFHTVIVSPWSTTLPIYGWMMLMAFLVTAACGWVGNFLILRRMALMGDAVSHSILPGLVFAFILTGSLNLPAMFIGAICSGLFASFLIEALQFRNNVKPDAAMGITFCSLFALGVLLINLFGSKVHIDPDCVLYGELSYLYRQPGEYLPQPIQIMLYLLLGVMLLTRLFYKPLMLSSFDPTLAAAMGYSPKWIQLGLMCVLSLVIVAAFESVGAILVVAMLILPGASAQQCSHRLPICLGLSLLHAALSAILGIHLAIWLDCSVAGAVVVAGTILFCLTWIFGPQGLMVQQLKKRV